MKRNLKGWYLYYKRYGFITRIILRRGVRFRAQILVGALERMKITTERTLGQSLIRNNFDSSFLSSKYKKLLMDEINDYDSRIERIKRRFCLP